MNEIRKGDHIIVRIGKDKGKQGIVLTVPAEYAAAEGVNVAERHVHPNPMSGIAGGVVGRVIPIHISSVAFVDAGDKPSRVGIKVKGGVRTCVLKAIGTAVGV